MTQVSAQIRSPGTFHQPVFKSPGECAQKFIEAIALKGIDLRETILPDGKLHRFAAGGKGQKDGWYVFYGMAGAFGDWHKGIQEKWSLQDRGLSSSEKGKLRQQIEKAQKAAEEERCRRQEEAMVVASKTWATCSETGHSPYLLKKKVDAFGVRFQESFVVVPVRDAAGKLCSLQWIAPDGTKRFLAGGRKKGCFHPMGDFEQGKPVYVVEGYATGASIYRATRQTTVVAFDAGNLSPVIEALKKAYPTSPLIIAGDDDRWKGHNTGREKAEQAARQYGCSLVFSKFKTTQGQPTDFNDLHVLEGLEEVKVQLERAKPFPCEEESMPDPLPVQNTLLPVLPFTLDMLPESLQPWVKDIADRRQCPLDFVAVPAIVMIASLIGARCSVKPHEKDDWTVVPNLWGGILGDPGTLKSPVCSEALFPFGYLESKAMESYTEKKVQYEAEKTIFLEAKAALEGQIKSRMEQKGGEGTDHLKGQLANLLANTPCEPALTRYKVSDTTVEKMQEILSQNPKGVLVFRDELMGFLESWEKKGHESDRSFYLEAWNGDKPYTVDRIGRGTIHAQNICVSILGTTQPDKIRAYLHKAIKKLDNDGLLQRFQLLVYPDKKPWKLVDEYPDLLARNRVFDICKAIDTMPFADYGAQGTEPLYDGQYTIPFFRLSSKAQAFFHNWLKILQEKLNSPDHPIILQHLSKYRSLMPSLALIFHIIDNADEQRERNLTLPSLQKAAAWCAYLESHARRIYGMVLDPAFEAVPTPSKAEELLAWMRKQTNRPDHPLQTSLHIAALKV
jgi:putative DNA primase/helicase